MEVLIFAAFIWAIVAAAMADKRGRSPVFWFCVSLCCLGIMGPAILFFIGETDVVKARSRRVGGGRCR